MTRKRAHRLSEEDLKEIFKLRFGLVKHGKRYTWKEIADIKQINSSSAHNALWRLILALKENPSEVKVLMDRISPNMPFRELTEVIDDYIEEDENNRLKLINSLTKLRIEDREERMKEKEIRWTKRYFGLIDGMMHTISSVRKLEKGTPHSISNAIREVIDNLPEGLKEKAEEYSSKGKAWVKRNRPIKEVFNSEELAEIGKVINSLFKKN
jgi:hypothetical protein